MILSDDDRPIRIRPRKPPVARREAASWTGAYRLLMHYARASRKLRGTGGASGKVGPVRPYIQRCAVRVTYLSNKTRGQWRAHGRYLARESATESKAAASGFNRERDGIDLVCELEKWQSAGDQRLWKVILSPEFGDCIDLQRLARDVVGQIENDFGTDLEWIAVTHHNTEHPHVHMVIRGVASAGEPLHFKREYVKHGIRSIAEEVCKHQLGYRTSRDAAEAGRREISAYRFTALDRALLRDAEKGPPQAGSAHSIIVKEQAKAGHNESARLHENHLISRLAFLQHMGLADSTGPNTGTSGATWKRFFGRCSGPAIGRERLQRTVFRSPTSAFLTRSSICGRSPQSKVGYSFMGRMNNRARYLMLEGTDAKVHFIYCTAEMEEARSNGELRTNSFIRLSRVFVGGKPIVDIHDFGDADQALKNRALFGESARALVKRGIAPTEDGWGGWLGRFQAALASTAREFIRSHEFGADRSQERKREGPHGR